MSFTLNFVLKFDDTYPKIWIIECTLQQFNTNKRFNEYNTFHAFTFVLVLMYMTHKGWNFCVTIFGKDTSSYMVTFWIYICPQNFMWWTCGWMQYYKFYGALTPKIFQKILNILQYLLIRLVRIVLLHSWSSRCLL